MEITPYLIDNGEGVNPSTGSGGEVNSPAIDL